MYTEWKNKPIEEALQGRKCVPHLKAAGLNTAGQVIDLTSEEIARVTKHIGIKRADKIRNAILQDAKGNNKPKKAPQRREPNTIIINMPEQKFSYLTLTATALVMAAIVFGVSFLIELIA